MRCPQCGSTNPAELTRCEECGAKLAPRRQAAEDEDLEEEEKEEREPRPRRRRPRRSDAGDEVVSTIIPYKNPKALISYYLGIFSLVCVLGFFLAPVSLTLGILGLRYRREHPDAHGTAHAWVGIVLSSLSLLGHLAVIVLIIIGSLKK